MEEEMGRKFIFLLLAVLTFSVGFTAGQCTRAAWAFDKEVQFAWDANVTEDPNLVPWERVEVYQRILGGQFDFSAPIAVVPQTYADNQSTPSQTPKLVVNFPDGANTTYEYAARAAASVGGENIFSAESNIVSLNLNLTPIEDISFDVAFNDQTGTLDFVWQVTDDRITSWKVFSKTGEEEPFVELATIDREGDLSQVSTSVPEGSLFPMGAMTTVTFAVVGVGPNGESSTSITKPVTRDRRTATGEVVNFKIILE
jgi:hypothetical protein